MVKVEQGDEEFFRLERRFRELGQRRGSANVQCHSGKINLRTWTEDGNNQ